MHRPETRQFTAATSKFAYAQAFTAPGSTRPAERRSASVLGRLLRHRAR